MGSGLGSMSKLTNRMGGQSVGGVGAVCGCLGVLQGKWSLQKQALLMVKMWDDHNFALQL